MKNLINISDLKKKDINEIIKFDKTNHLSKFKDILRGKSIGLIFEKFSTRTRVSFKVAINQMGGSPIDINFNELNFQRNESFEDTFKTLSLYLDGIVYRTSDHNKIELASQIFNKPVINALSDISHPCQILSDLFTLKEHFGKINNLTITWLGDTNNVLFSLIEACILLNNFNLNIFTDKNIYKKFVYPKHKKVNFFFNIDNKILSKTDCIMTDVFFSMNDKHSKKNFLKKFQVNENIMSMCKSDTVFMHCLPANIDEEVTKKVFNSINSIVWKQAENRMYIQKNILKKLFIDK